LGVLTYGKPVLSVVYKALTLKMHEIAAATRKINNKNNSIAKV